MVKHSLNDMKYEINQIVYVLNLIFNYYYYKNKQVDNHKAASIDEQFYDVIRKLYLISSET